MPLRFYLLTVHKINQNLAYVARSYNDLEGESQAFHYFVRNLTGKQLASISVRYLHQARKLHPEDETLETMEKNLIKILVERYKIEYADYLFGADATANTEAWKAKLDPEADPRINQRASTKFFLNDFDGIDDEELQSFFQEAIDNKEDKRITGTFSWKRFSFDDYKSPVIEENLEGKEPGNMLVLEPLFIRANRNNNVNLGTLEYMGEDFTVKFKGLLKEEVGYATYMNLDDLQSSEVDRYNLYADTKEWINKRNYLEDEPEEEVFDMSFAHSEEYRYVLTVNVTQFSDHRYLYFYRCYDTLENEIVRSQLELIKKKDPTDQLINLLDRFIERLPFAE